MPYVVTNKGLDIIASRIKGIGTEPLYIAWGSGAGVAAITDTILFGEESEARVAGISQITTISVADDTYMVSGSMTADADKIITNWGLFDALIAGNLLAHESVSPGLAISLGQSIAFTFRIQILRA